MNERHPSLSAGGPTRSRLWKDTKPPQTSPLHTSANQETRSEDPSETWNRRVNAGGEKITLSRWSADSRRQFGYLATGGKDHIQTHMYTQTEIPESSQARTITHCPPPPPTQGRTSQRPKRVGQFRPRTTTRTPTPPPQNSPSSLFLSTYFSPLLFLPLFVCCFSSLLFFFFFKLVNRTRREAACGKELSLLSFDDVISVVVPQRMFLSLKRKKKASSFFMIFFLFSICLSIFLLFFVNDNKKDLPLNVQDVFSHTWTGFLKTSVGEIVLPFLPFETADFLENL